jgi:predicted ester cyclase
MTLQTSRIPENHSLEGEKRMSSSVVDIVKAYFGTFSLMTVDKAALFLADDFKLVGMTADPLGKDAWVRLMKAFKTAMPDLKIKLSEVRAEGNVVSLTQSSVGTHRGPMDLSSVDLPVIPSSGKTVTFLSTQWVLTVVGGKITQEEMVTPPSPDTGLAGILKAFGGTIPAA